MSDKKRGTTSMQIKKNKAAYLLAAPFLLLFSAFVVIPAAGVVILSFFSYDMSGFPEFAGLENFQSLFGTEGEFPSALGNSMLIFLAAGLGGFVLSFAAAWGMEFLPKKIADILTCILFSISFVGTITAAVWLAGGLRSPLNSLLLSLELSDVPADWLSDERYAMGCVIFSQLWTTFGLGFMVLRSGFRSVDREKIDAARLEGVKNPLWTLTFAQIPSIYPQIAFAAAVQTAFAFTNSEVIRILSGTSAEGFKAYGIMTYIFDYGSRLDAGKVCAANFILIALMTIIYAAARIAVNKLSKSV